MSEQSSQEPTMEEILASIRRIISEDEAPAAAPGAEAESVTPPEEKEEVLDLVDPIAPVETHGDIDVFVAPSPPAPADMPVASSSAEPDESLISNQAAGAAANAFGSLSAAIAMPKEGRSLEDVTRELLRPLLKAWLDENLPRIASARVEEEVARIARLRG